MGNLKELTDKAKKLKKAKEILDTLNNPSFINKMDWEMLRNQKLSLLQIIEKLKRLKDDERADDLTGILHLIDALQDFAVDELGIPSTVIFNFEAEENRDD